MKINAIQRFTILGLIAYLPFWSSSAFAVANNPPTQTIQIAAPEKVGIEKYSGATELTPQELVDLLSLAGFKGYSLKVAWAITMRESRGHPLSHNTSAYSGDNSYGLFQINMIGSLGSDRREKFGITKDSELLDPVVNAKAAFYMTARGTNFGSWGIGPDAYDGTPEESAVTKWIDDFPK